MAKRRPGQAAKPVAPSKPSAKATPDQTITETIAPTQTPPLATGAPEASSKPALPITFPTWPTSKPGPWVTPPLPGMRPINALRPEQVAEIGYDQETGEPGLQSVPTPEADLTRATQSMARKPKKERL